jgi:anaerobic selenocysteine-containing dehydrogenase
MAKTIPSVDQSVHYRTCTLCEAMCGIEIKHVEGKITSIKGDKQDSFSNGHICPKAVALQDLYTDKDRLTEPMMKVDGKWEKVGWEFALSEVALRFKATQKEHGNDAVGVYLGNPNVHNIESMLFGSDFYRSLKTKNKYSATSVDQLPHHLAALQMFGHPLLMPIPDIDRCNHMLIMGANPIVSNGSIMSVPNVKKRLKAIQTRGGKIITIDPRFTETSKVADQHHFITPGSDALLVMAMINYLFDQQLVDLARLADHVENLDKVEKMIDGFDADSVASDVGIKADDIRQLVVDFVNADRAVLYARLGVSTHEFGSVVNWLVNLFNILTGSFDEAGGLMLTAPAIDMVGSKKAKSAKFARFHSRVSGYPETIGELPVVALAEEILTPGEGQIKAMFIGAGNPLLSTPNNSLLEKAFDQLEFIVSLDFFLNETSRKADIILPPPSALERPHYDLVFNHLAVRNYARYSKPLFERKAGQMSEADIYMNLREKMASKDLISKIKAKGYKWVLKRLGVKGMLEKGIKKGPYADQLNIKKLSQLKHGIDLGELTSQFPKKILTMSGKINLAPEIYLKDLERLKDTTHLTSKPEEEFKFRLIGRRAPRTCNSWLHNSYRMVKGKPACIALINDQDAQSMGIEDGQLIRVSSRVGQVEIPVETTSEIMPNVVSIPHGWGHGKSDTNLSIANAHQGISVNELTDEKFVDKLTGNAALNGVPVSIEAV